MNLVPAIRQMEEAISAKKSAHAKEIQELETGLAALRKLNTVCEKCGGEGKYMRPRACAEDDREREYIRCSECQGTGKALKESGENKATDFETSQAIEDTQRVDFSKLSYSELCAFLENNSS